jgi:hypothetical protein
VNVNRVGVAVTLAQFAPALAVADNGFHTDRSVQNHMCVFTTVYARPSGIEPAGNRPGTGTGNSNDDSACRAKVAGDGGAGDGGVGAARPHLLSRAAYDDAGQPDAFIIAIS